MTRDYKNFIFEDDQMYGLCSQNQDGYVYGILIMSQKPCILFNSYSDDIK